MRTLAALLALLVASACGGDESARPRNVLVVTVDTVRADRLGCYGFAGARTPVIDRLAREGARFDSAWSHVPLTQPSHAALFTGRLPPELGIHDNGRATLPPAVPTLAELLRARGLRTGAFVSAVVLERGFGLARGFDVYDDELARTAAHRGERPADATIDAALAWLDEAPEQPFFAWVHLYDPHEPYEPPAAFAASGAHPYDGEIAFADAQIGRLVATLERRGALDDTLVVVTSDHGEGLGEHGESTHGTLVFASTMRVPLVVRARGIAPSVQSAPVGLCDVFPTVLELAGEGAIPPTGARSLVPLLEGSTLPEKPVYGESAYAALNFGWRPLHALSGERWRYLDHAEPLLFDLARDPREQDDRSGSDADTAERFRDELARVRERLAPLAGAGSAADPAKRAQLEALGYVQSDASAHDPSASTVDPLEKIAVVDEFLAGFMAQKRGDLEVAVQKLESAARAEPGAPTFRSQLGLAYEAAGRSADAVRELREAVRLAPRSEMTRRFLVEVLERSSDSAGALAECEEGLRISQSSQALLAARARCLDALGRGEEALEAWRALARARPQDAGAAFALHGALRVRGDRAAATAALESFVERNPDAHNVALLLAWEIATRAGASAVEGQRAVALARRALAGARKRTPDDLDTLAAALARAGDFEAALAALDEALTRLGTAEPALRAELGARRSAYAAGRAFEEP